MKERIIQDLFNRLLPSQQYHVILSVREEYVLTDAEICQLFGITETEMKILLS